MTDYKNVLAISFQTEKNYYIYDTSTNFFLKVDPIIQDILDDYHSYAKSEMIDKWKSIYNEERIEAAISSIETAKQKHKVFSSFRIPKFSISDSKGTLECVKERLSVSVPQLILNLGEDCNLRCEYCVYSGAYSGYRTHNRYKKMNWQVAKKAIDFFLDHSYKAKWRILGFYGGEPLLYFNLLRKCAEYARVRDPRFYLSVTTNGTLISNEILKFFVENDFTLFISLDGPQKVHDRYRKFKNGRGTFDYVVANLRRIKNYSPEYYNSRVKFSAVIAPPYDVTGSTNAFFSNSFLPCSKNRDKLMAAFVSKKGSKFLEKFKSISSNVSKFKEEIFELIEDYHISGKDLSEITLYIALYQKSLAQIHFRSHKHIADYSYYWPNGACIPGSRSIFVTCDGFFQPCEKCISNIVIGDIWGGFYYQKIADYINEYNVLSIEDCRNCWAYRFCDACILFAHNNNGFSLSEKRSYCKNYKEYLPLIFILYNRILERIPNAFEYMKTDVLERLDDYIDFSKAKRRTFKLDKEVI
jgi:uncharacterized protein